MSSKVMGRLGCAVWAEQNGARTKARARERTNENLRMVFFLFAQPNRSFSAKKKFTPLTGMSSRGGALGGVRKPAVLKGRCLLAHHPQPRRHVVFSQLMAAARAELVGRAHCPEAVSATGGKLIVALRAEMEITLHMRGAGRAPRNLRLAQQEVEHRADAARHHEADGDPEARAHRPPRRIPADITHHQEVE